MSMSDHGDYNLYISYTKRLVEMQRRFLSLTRPTYDPLQGIFMICLLFFQLFLHDDMGISLARIVLEY
jgi:hypothetical protein